MTNFNFNNSGVFLSSLVVVEAVLCFVCLLLPLQFAVGEGTTDGMPILQSRWDLPVPDCLFCDTSELIFRFDMSTIVEDYMTQLHLLRGEDCEIDIWENNYLIPHVEYDLAPSDDGQYVRQIALVLIPDISLISNSPIYSISEDETTGTLNFCVKLEIFTQDSSTIVNWRDVEYNQTTTLQEGIRKLEIKLDDYDIYNEYLQQQQQQHRLLAHLDCSNGYDVVFENWWTNNGLDGIAVDPNNITYSSTGDENGNYSGVMVGPFNADMVQLGLNISYNLDAYECDEDNAPVIVPVYNQGDLFRICIKPDEVAISDGLLMRQLDSMSYSKPDDDLTQYAVEGGQADFFGFSEFQCTSGSSVCWVETLLKAEFFASAGFVNIVGIGSLQFGSRSTARRSRSLYNLDSNSDNSRELQDQDRQELGRFAFQCPVTTFQETMDYRIKESNSISNGQAIALVVLSITLVMNCVFVFWIRQSRRILNISSNISSNISNISNINNHTSHQGKGLVKQGKSSKRTKSGRSIDCEDVVDSDTKRKKPKRKKPKREKPQFGV